MSRADLVESYQQRGWWLFTCRVGAKQPHGRTGVNGATNDLVTLRRWWKSTDYNIGIDCGRSQLVVVDLDVDKERADSWVDGGPTPGISWWLERCEQNDYDPFGTYCVVTPRNGMHIYFHLPPDVKVRSKNGQITPLVDIKSAGGYVLAAGSVVDGKEYEYADTQLEITDAPAWLLAMTVDREQTDEDRENIAAAHRKRAVEMKTDMYAVIRNQCNKLAATGEGQRNEMLNAIAFNLYYVADDEHMAAIEDELTFAARACGLKDREIQDTIKSARRAAGK